ncbi:MAG: hypothetical protein M5U10_17145 [Candidatus Methanoperedens sp.]|uniref:hypothetical protein n=1 Tax=Candidatus Methanoperedens nitratireducens TaxID=1392998 RepID=UPI0012FEB730|nr:hypothetical protein [Candidatus Methanoperedens nitroreducens]MDJ1423623.1 hypothetical protein [Candidatus Methanoperedens sp.]
MTLKTTIAANVRRRGLEQAPSVLEAHSFQYLESDISRAMERETMRETVAKAPPWDITSKEKEV